LYNFSIHQNQEIQKDLAYCLSFAPSDDSSDFAKNFNRLFPAERMKHELAYGQDQLRASSQRELDLDCRPLPHTLEDALRPSSRAVVITEAEAPFRIFDVNEAWEKLCGFSFLESRGKTLGSLLRGSETNQLAATGLIVQLLHGEEAGTTLTNYTKSGLRFRNRIHVGPLTSNGKITHFVGVLQEVQDGM
jgi:PAS domain S-box-containing protein